MEFCPKCNCFLMEDTKRKVLVCNKCKFEKPVKGSQSQKFVEVIKKPKQELIIKDRSNPKESTLPTTRAECKKCGNMEVYYWMVQTRSADEPSTRFYRCTKCNMTWREYE